VFDPKRKTFYTHCGRGAGVTSPRFAITNRSCTLPVEVMNRPVREGVGPVVTSRTRDPRTCREDAVAGWGTACMGPTLPEEPATTYLPNMGREHQGNASCTRINKATLQTKGCSVGGERDASRKQQKQQATARTDTPPAQRKTLNVVGHTLYQGSRAVRFWYQTKTDA